MSENTAVQISKKRLNGVRLRAAENHRKLTSEMLDVILDNANIPELSDKELQEKIRELEQELSN